MLEKFMNRVMDLVWPFVIASPKYTSEMFRAAASQARFIIHAHQVCKFRSKKMENKDMEQFSHVYHRMTYSSSLKTVMFNSLKT